MVVGVSGKGGCLPHGSQEVREKEREREREKEREREGREELGHAPSDLTSFH
jgi:hypothetical protein